MMVNISRVWHPVAPSNTTLPSAVPDSGSNPLNIVLSSFELSSPPVDSGASTPLALLPPGTNRLLLGLLAEDLDGNVTLGITTYLGGGHKGIVAAFMETFIPAAFLWGGELEFTNREPTQGLGIITRINETSGYLSECSPPAGSTPPRNSVDHLLQQLRRRSPFSLSEGVAVDRFDPAKQHLDSRLNGFGDNWRHELGNNFGALKANIALRKVSDTTTGVDEEGLRNLYILAQIIMETLGIPGDEVQKIESFNRSVQKLVDGEELGRDEYLSMEPALQIMRRVISQGVLPGGGNICDLYILQGSHSPAS